MNNSSDILQPGDANDHIKETLRCILVKQGETVLQLLEGPLELRVEQIAEIKAFVKNANALSSGLKRKALTSSISGQEYSLAVEDIMKEELAVNCDQIYARFLPFWKDLSRSRKEKASGEPDVHWDNLLREVVALPRWHNAVVEIVNEQRVAVAQIALQAQYRMFFLLLCSDELN
ncbi:hypothetical protein QFC20_006295 [Naganishia adeliensis]|uniref:Uncharacterized protein n=1 Tax=Naganishia adeliensis TaxID=92952 RepID=A0ACC2VDA5_9TREE|nr:hypothetical protein QFC20_006295 [Naganishia adeliensis]